MCACHGEGHERRWWPGRRIQRPRPDELITAVVRRAGIGDAEANRAAQATLATLSERLSRSEARTLGAQLPSAFRTALEGASRWAVRFALDELVDETTMAYVRSRLGEEFAQPSRPVELRR